TYTVRASFAGNSNYDPASAIKTIVIGQASTAITLDNKTSGTNFDCANTYTATLMDTSNNVPLSGVVLKLTIGTQGPVTKTTDANGKATFTLTLNQPPGSVTESVGLNATWSDSNRVAPVAVSRSFTVIADPNVGPAYNT